VWTRPPSDPAPSPRSAGLARALAGAILGGALFSLAFPPTPWGLALGWVALVPLLHAIDGATVRRAFAAGWLFGLVRELALSTVVWPIPGAQPQHVLVPCAYLALYPALWCGGIAALRSRLRSVTARDLLAVSLWPLTEFARGHAGFLALPVGSPAETQVGNLPLLQTASVLGEPGVTLLVVLGNVAVWRALRGAPPARVVVLAAPVAAAHVVGAIVLGLPAVMSPPATVTIAALHTAFPAFGPRAVAVERRAELTVAALARAPANAEALLAPESAFVDPAADPARLQVLQELANRRRIPVAVGVAQAVKFDRPRSSARLEDRRVRAGVWVFRPGASAPDRYDKAERVPFREYLPLAGKVHWPVWLVGRALEVVAGPGPRVYDLAPPRRPPLPVGFMVCWESLVAGHARRLASDGATVLLQASNEGWFAGTTAGARHAAVTRLRAVETGRPVIIAANAGPAMIVDHRGRVLAESAAMGAMGWVTAAVEPRRGLTIYTRIGDAIVLACGLAVVALLGVAWTAERPSTRGGGPGHGS
jgi:apolipoprotein N-acyltransferase